MRKNTIAALSLAVCAGSLVGCSAPQQANYRPPRADELRPGDIAPAPGPFVESQVPPGVQAVQPGARYRPLPAPYQVPAYQMPIKPTVSCTTQRIGAQSYTNCN